MPHWHRAWHSPQPRSLPALEIQPSATLPLLLVLLVLRVLVLRLLQAHSPHGRRHTGRRAGVVQGGACRVGKTPQVPAARSRHRCTPYKTRGNRGAAAPHRPPRNHKGRSHKIRPPLPHRPPNLPGRRKRMVRHSPPPQKLLLRRLLRHRRRHLMCVLDAGTCAKAGWQWPGARGASLRLQSGAHAKSTRTCTTCRARSRRRLRR